jgi:lipopolysaccharide export system permease protein
MPTILTLALFISIVFTLSRMYRDSEMIIWFASGRSLGGLLGPVMRFSWPVLLVITFMVFFVWPWANQQTNDLRDRFEQRGDLDRVAPGQFQESSSGRRVFFIDKDTADGTEGRNIFISSIEEDGAENVTSARSARIETIDNQQMLILSNGQRLDTSPDTGDLKVSEFEEYATQIGSSRAAPGSEQALKAMSSWQLLVSPTLAKMGELGWRIGVGLTALNFVLIALATTVSNPRAGRGGNLFFTMFAFILYFNFLNIGQRWVTSGLMGLGSLLIVLHGTVFLLAVLWLAKRHHNFSVREGMLALMGRRASL